MKFPQHLAHRVKHISLAAGAGLIFMMGFAAGNFQTHVDAQGLMPPNAEVEEAFEPFWQAFNLIQSDYIEEVELESLVDGAIRGLYTSLGDQFSSYMTPEEFEMMNSDLEGEIDGIGVVIRTNLETLEIEVVGLITGSPAQDAGVRVGDIFYEVDGETVIGMDQLQLAQRVRGPVGSVVNIIFLREGEPIDLSITRARIVVPNVESEILEDDIAYIRLNQFSANARADLNAAVESLNVNSRSGLIVDVRDNPGGLLSSAIDISSAFIPEGEILTEAFGDGREEVLNVNGTYLEIDVPIVLLVNGGSASASELFAGALQDYDLATIIGETTFGKGTVQTWQPLINGGGVRLTIARWITPDGSWIHEAGITPDYTVVWPPEDFDNPVDPQIQAAIEFLETGALPTVSETPVLETVGDK